MNSTINSKIGDYILKVDNLRNLVRYQTAPRVSSETVAEHSYFVAAYVLKLADYYDFDIRKALTMALLHDFSEVYISDVPHPIKARYPEINKSLEKAEYDVNVEHISAEFAKDMEEFNNMSTAEGTIVALADILSVITYSKYESELGNSKYMKDVFNNALNRYNHVLRISTPYFKQGLDSWKFYDDMKNLIDF